MPPISLGIGLSISMQGRGGKAWRDYDLFETGSGFLYDFSRADALFQEATGTTPAGVDQNVGLALDVSKWGGKTLAQVLAGQAEKVVNGGFDTNLNNWSNQDSGTGVSSWDSGNGGRMALPRVDGSNFARREQIITTVVGRLYRVEVIVSGASYSSRIGTSTGAGGQLAVVACSVGTTTFYFTATSTTTYVSGIGITNGTTPYVDNVSVKEVPGNHASQATSGARPVLKAGGLTRYDGSDDGLVMTVNPSAATTFLVEGKLPSSNSRYFGGVNGAGTSRLYLGTNSDVLAALVGSGTALLGTAALSESGVFGVMNDGTTASLIQNGAIVASQAQAGAPTTAFPIALGFVNNSGTPAGWGNSDIYKALAINRALTPAEIVKLTNYWNTH